MTAINDWNASLGNLTFTWDTNKNKKSESIGGVMSGYGFTSRIGFQPVVQTSSGIGFQPVVQTSSGIGFQRPTVTTSPYTLHPVCGPE
ncbi:MAG: hypothetical protein NTY42_14975 [Planctomycetota bacterium]|nr:hypothetical protein [Planctomycetota bacterium]